MLTMLEVAWMIATTTDQGEPRRWYSRAHGALNHAPRLSHRRQRDH